MSKVAIVMSIELKQGMNGADFEEFVVNELHPKWEEIPGLQASLHKGDRGKRDGKYLVINTYERVKRLDQLWPSWGEPTEEIEQWITAHQELWDKLWAFCEITEHTGYVEIN